MGAERPNVPFCPPAVSCPDVVEPDVSRPPGCSPHFFSFSFYSLLLRRPHDLISLVSEGRQQQRTGIKTFIPLSYLIGFFFNLATSLKDPDWLQVTGRSLSKPLIFIKDCCVYWIPCDGPDTEIKSHLFP